MRYSAKQLATALHELLTEKPSAHRQIITQFAAFLKKTGNYKIWDNIEHQLETLRRQKEGAIKVEITTAGKNQPTFPTKIGDKKVELVWQTDPTLLSGTIIKIDDLRIDNSVKDRLNNLKRAFKS